MRSYIVSLLVLLCTHLMAQHQPLKKVEASSISEVEVSSNIKSGKRILTVKFDPSGNQIMTGSLDKTLKSFKISDGTLLWSQTGAEFEPISSVNLPSTNPLLISAQNQWAGGAIFLFNWANGENLGKLSPYAGGRGAIDFFGAPGTSKVAWGGPDGKVFVFNFTKNALETSTGYPLHNGKIYSIAYGPYGNLFSAGQDGKVINRKSDGTTSTILTFEKPVLSMAMNPYIKGKQGNERFIAAGDNRGNFKVKNLGSGQIMYEATVGDECKAVKFHPTDPDLLIAMSKQSLHLIDFRQNKELKKIDIDEVLWSLDVSMDGSKLAVGTESGQIKLYKF